jgi:cytochrome c-type biogenesis protein CcmH
VSIDLSNLYSRIGLLLTTVVILAGSLMPADAAIETYQFDDPQQEATYRKLIKELRCTVCQNQDIGDSNAELAQDLRRKTYEMVVDGKSEEYVLDYMSSRYGDFVLYRPRMKTSTVLLWLGPFLLLLTGVIVVVRIIRGRRSHSEQALSEQERQRAEQLLHGDKQ